jgi:beta-lactamase regulating signal transducer with metallopeptidase domain
MLNILWKITVGSWVTAAAIILVRLVFRRVLSARAKYLLWMLLVLRLCLPVLPYSPFSLMGAVEQLPNTAHVTVEAVTERIVVNQAHDIPNTSNATETATDQAYKVSWQEVLVAVWVTGVLISLGVYLALSLRTRKRLKQAKFVDDPETIRTFLAIRGKLRITQEIWLCYGQEPLIGGLRHPVLLIPRELSGDQLEAALTHELLHYRSGDLWIAAFQRILCCIYWFDPVVWLCFHQARLDCERACDQRVLEQGYVSPALYAELLYTEGRMKTKLQVGTTAFGRQDLKARLTAIARFKKPALWMTILAIVLSLGVTACTMTESEKAETNVEAEHQSVLSSEETADSDEMQISGYEEAASQKEISEAADSAERPISGDSDTAESNEEASTPEDTPIEPDYSYQQPELTLYAQEDNAETLDEPTTTFKTTEHISYAVQVDTEETEDDKTVSKSCIIRDASGNIVQSYNREHTWPGIWTTIRSTADLPDPLTVPGTYTLEVYFNDQFIASQEFTVQE